MAALNRGAQRYTKARGRVQGRPELPADVFNGTNELLIRSERVLISPDGLPRCPWFKHLIYAPGVYAGYGAKTMPGVREAIEQKRAAEADDEMARIAKVLQEEEALVDSAATALEKVVD